MISSSAPSSRGNNLISCQRVTNSCISSLVRRGQTCETQLLFCSALRTVTFFLLTFKKRLGAIFFGAVPLIQLECQKLVLSPLPTVTIVEALKRSLSVASQGLSRLAQGLSSFFHLYQYQRSRKTLASRSRSRTPSPPRSLGVHTVGQFTRQWPPLTFSGSSPFQRKLRRILSICLMSHFCTGESVRW